MGVNPHAGLLDVERFMKRYFLVAKEVGDLTRIFCAVIEADHNRRSRLRLPTLRRRRKVEGFGLEADRLTVPGPEALAATPGDDRKSIVKEKSVAVRVDPGGRRIIKKK